MGRTTTAITRSLGITLAIVVLGAWPAHAVWGREGVVGLGLAAATGFLGALLGRLPRIFFRTGPDAVFHAALAGVGARLLGTLVLAAPLMLLAPYPLEAMAIGLLLTYLSLLALEVRDLLIVARGETSNGIGRPDNGPDGAPTR